MSDVEDAARLVAAFVECLLGPVGRDELLARLSAWATEEAERNPVVAEAEHHAAFAVLDEDQQREWYEVFGDQQTLVLTDERMDRFLADNLDIAARLRRFSGNG